MMWLNLALSNQWKLRAWRHLAGWALWWLYVVFTIFITRENSAGSGPRGFYHHQPGLQALGYLQYGWLVVIKSFLLLLIHFFFCYVIIYFLVARRLHRHYWATGFALLFICVITVPLGYFLYAVVYPFVDSLFSFSPVLNRRWMLYASIDAGLINGIKLTLVAAAIQLLKKWWLKQQEKERLEQEKIKTEIQLLKAQIHPTFLFNTLHHIIDHARAASTKAPEMLIQLSDLLSYMLYECDAPEVKLEREISMLKKYMILEKTRQGESLELTFSLNGDPHDQLISPLLLLPFLENSFAYSNHERLDQAWINLEITVDSGTLSMKLINGMPEEMPWDHDMEERLLGTVKKRLSLLYPGRHVLKINREQELLMVHLNLTLEEPGTGPQPAIHTTKPVLSYDGI